MHVNVKFIYSIDNFDILCYNIFTIKPEGRFLLMNRTILYYENRISVLLGRAGADNKNIINKLRRKIRLLEAKQE
jgi:hypothetical protein